MTIRLRGISGSSTNYRLQQGFTKHQNQEKEYIEGIVFFFFVIDNDFDDEDLHIDECDKRLTKTVLLAFGCLWTYKLLFRPSPKLPLVCPEVFLQIFS